MAELVLLLFALLALESLSVSIGFILAAIGVSVWRQHKLRKELEDFRQDWTAQNDALHRELIDLRSQLAASGLRTPKEDRPARAAEEQPVRPMESRTPLEKTGSVAVTAPEQMPFQVAEVPAPASTMASQVRSTSTRAEPETESAHKPPIPPAVLI